MRFVIFGAGAIGGVVGANLHQAGLRRRADRPRRSLRSDPRPRPEARDAAPERGARDPGGGLTVRARVRGRGGRDGGDQEPGHGGRARGAARRRAGEHAGGVPPERGRERADRAAAVRERIRRGRDVADRAPRAGDRPVLRDPGHRRDRRRPLPGGPRRAVRGDRAGARRVRLQLGRAAGHHALQVREAAREPGQRRRRDLRAGAGRRRGDRAGSGGGPRRAERRGHRVRRRRRQRGPGALGSGSTCSRSPAASAPAPRPARASPAGCRRWRPTT